MYVADGGLVLYSDKKLEMQLLPDCNGPTTTTFFILAAIEIREASTKCARNTFHNPRFYFHGSRYALRLASPPR